MAITPFLHNGELVPLDHMAPTSFGCPCEAIGRDLMIGVIFRSHCYTEKFDPLVHSKDRIVLYDAPNRPRVFCPIRHALSFQLPELICALPSKKVFQTTQRRNYLYTVKMALNGQIYEIYFMLQRAEKEEGIDLRLTVESAYPVPVPSQLPRRPNKIRFSVLALKILRREEIKFASR